VTEAWVKSVLVTCALPPCAPSQQGAEIAVAPHTPGLFVASLYVPGAAENMPALAYGSVVRLRPSWKPRSDTPATEGDPLAPDAAASGDLITPFVEIEARVLSVSLAHSVVELRLPSEWQAKSCMRCDSLYAAGQLWTWPAPLPAVALYATGVSRGPEPPRFFPRPRPGALPRPRRGRHRARPSVTTMERRFPGRYRSSHGNAATNSRSATRTWPPRVRNTSRCL
jgi:hypothetical protein